jgi:hypothetical protein
MVVCLRYPLTSNLWTQYTATYESSKAIYDALSAPILSSVIPSDEITYYNAYAIFDYLNYMNKHNNTVAALLSDPKYIGDSNISYFDSVRRFADTQQYAELANLTQVNSYVNNSSASLSSGVSGSISTIAGNLLAAKMLAQLQVAIETSGDDYKLSLLFGDFEPLMSMFALMGTNRAPSIHPSIKTVTNRYTSCNRAP